MTERDESGADPAEPGADRFVDGYLLSLMARASFVASAQFHAILARRGVPVSTWRVLATLAGSGAMQVGELARIVLLKQPTLTKTLNRLEAAGLIRRGASDADRRHVLVRLTPEGEALAAELTGEARAHERSLMAMLGRDGERLKRSLRRLAAALEP